MSRLWLVWAGSGMDGGHTSKALEPCREENNEMINVLIMIMKFALSLISHKIKKSSTFEKLESEK